MKYRHCTLGFKITAFILVFILAGLAFASAVGADICLDSSVYTRSETDYYRQELRWRALEDCTLVANTWAQEHFGSETHEYWLFNGETSSRPPQYAGYSNLRFEIYDMQGTLLVGNYTGEETCLETEVILTPEYWIGQEITEPTVSMDSYDDDGALVYEYYGFYENRDYHTLSYEVRVKAYVVKNMTIQDGYYWNRLYCHVLYTCRYAFIAMVVLGTIGAAWLACWLLWASGRRKGEDGVFPTFFDRIPLDALLLAGLLVLTAVAEVFYVDEFVLIMLLGVSAPMALLTLMSICTRLKMGGGYWYRQTLCFWAARWCWNLRKPLMRLYYLLPLAWRWLAVGAGIGFTALLAFAAESPFLLVLAILAAIAFFAYVAFSLARLQKEIGRFAEGNLDRGVELKYLYGSFRRMGEQIGTLGETADRAVAQRLKSERMKTELITNVSHDIKTPLTSIVTYVDLLKNAPDEETRREYLDVLDRQAQKLKKLTVDLIDVSKAASGAMPVDLQKTNLVELVNQALGEYQSKMESASLNILQKYPEVEPIVMADGRLLWRVLDNLFGNCVKYALPGTRVYVDVEQAGNSACVVIKNISRDALNIPAEELMERFVRGDRSRNTEGSGLGLNIALNLMELQGGSLNLEVDGDLFKVTAALPLA